MRTPRIPAVLRICLLLAALWFAGWGIFYWSASRGYQHSNAKFREAANYGDQRGEKFAMDDMVDYQQRMEMAYAWGLDYPMLAGIAYVIGDVLYMFVRLIRRSEGAD